MSQNDISCKIEDQGSLMNPNLLQNLTKNFTQNMIPALYNYTLIEYFLGYVESMSYNNLSPLQMASFPLQNKNFGDFDTTISPKKFLKLNTFDGEKVKLEDGSFPQEPIQTGPKAALSEASTQEGSNSCGIPEGVNKNCLKDKHSQNPRKNLPGLVLQRIRTSCLAALENKNKALCGADEIRLKYVKEIFEKLNKEEIEKFQEYFKLLNKNWKTWKKVHDYIHGNEAFAEIVQKVIEGFLSEEGTLDFNHWLTAGKMNKETKEVIGKSKEWLVVKFGEVFCKKNSGERVKKSSSSEE